VRNQLPFGAEIKHACLDSGASCIAFNTEDLFRPKEATKYMKNNEETVTIADGSQMSIDGRGYVGGMQAILLRRLPMNLLSVSTLNDAGFDIIWKKVNQWRPNTDHYGSPMRPGIYKDGRLVARIKRKNNLYLVELSETLLSGEHGQRTGGESAMAIRFRDRGSAKVKNADIDWTTLHGKMMHYSSQSLRKSTDGEGNVRALYNGKPIATNIGENAEENCVTCVQGNLNGAKLLRREQPRVAKLGELITVDIKGPVKGGNFDGTGEYVLVAIDEATKTIFAKILRNKSDAAAALRGFIETTTLEWAHDARNGEFKGPKSIKRIHSDGGAEIQSATLKEVAKRHGIHLSTTTPYTSDANAVVERTIQRLEKMAKRALLHAGLGVQFMIHGLIHAAQTLDLLPTTVTDPENGKYYARMSPYEARTGKLPDLRQLWTFGCTVYFHVSPKMSTAPRKGAGINARSGLGMTYDDKVGSPHTLYLRVWVPSRRQWFTPMRFRAIEEFPSAEEMIRNTRATAIESALASDDKRDRSKTKKELIDKEAYDPISGLWYKFIKRGNEREDRITGEAILGRTAQARTTGDEVKEHDRRQFEIDQATALWQETKQRGYVRTSLGDGIQRSIVTMRQTEHGEMIEAPAVQSFERKDGKELEMRLDHPEPRIEQTPTMERVPTDEKNDKTLALRKGGTTRGPNSGTENTTRGQEKKLTTSSQAQQRPQQSRAGRIRRPNKTLQDFLASLHNGVTTEGRATQIEAYVEKQQADETTWAKRRKAEALLMATQTGWKAEQELTGSETEYDQQREWRQLVNELVDTPLRMEELSMQEVQAAHRLMLTKTTSFPNIEQFRSCKGLMKMKEGEVKEKWRAAMWKELKGLVDMQTFAPEFTPVHKAPTGKVIRSMVIASNKEDNERGVVYKVRIAGMGNLISEDDYRSTYAPTGSITTF